MRRHYLSSENWKLCDLSLSYLDAFSVDDLNDSFDHLSAHLSAPFLYGEMAVWHID